MSLPTSVQHRTRVLARATNPEKEIKSINIGKGEVKLSSFTSNMIVYVENPKESTQKLLISNLAELQARKSKESKRLKTQRSIVFLYASNKQLRY